MDDFIYQNRTKIIFGRGYETIVGNEIRPYANKTLLLYGGGSIKKAGLYGRVLNSLKEAGLEVTELSGVRPNPRLSFVREGIKLCREKGVQFILAVGGGSVIDSAKAIAVGVPYKGDVWDFWAGLAEPEKALPVGVGLTIPAAGSESSISAVLTNEEGNLKTGLDCMLYRPVFAVMNPELTFTLPPYQTACGAADIMAHIMERYFTNTKDVDLTDRLCEAVLKTVTANAPKVLKEPENYSARAQIMWAGSLAHNGLLNTGRLGDWGSHKIEHEISAIYDIAHGAGLAIIFPAWMKYVYKHDTARFAQFAHRVWDVDDNMFNMQEMALAGISRLEEYFKSLGLPVRLSQINVDASRIEEMADKCTRNDTHPVGQFIKLKRRDVLNILKLAL